MKSGQFKDTSRSEWLLEAAEVVAEVVAVHGVPRVADDHLTALTVRKTPVDDVLTERTTGGLYMPVARAVRSERPSVEDVDGTARAFHLGFFTVEPGHFILVSLESSLDGHPQDLTSRLCFVMNSSIE